MKDDRKTKKQLIVELAELRRRIALLDKAERERKKAEDALRESDEKLGDLLRTIPECVYSALPNGEILYMSPAAKKMFGFSAKEFQRDKNLWIRRIHKDDKRQLLVKLEKLFKKGTPYIHEFRMKRKDGRLVWIRDHANAALDEKGRPARITGIIFDITARKQAEDALRESEQRLHNLSDHLLAAQERERKRISLELHDELGQALMVLKLRLRSIERKLRVDQVMLKEECEDSLQYLNQLVESVRRLSRDLMPRIMEDLGLSAALRRLAEDLAKHFALKVSFNIPHINQLFPEGAQITIYRIFQEALTNIGKHAQATCVSIVAMKHADRISFVVEDNGRGFDLEKAMGRNSAEKGMGLTAMHARARMVGGFFDIQSQAGKGTRIAFTIPINEGEVRNGGLPHSTGG